MKDKQISYFIENTSLIEIAKQIELLVDQNESQFFTEAIIVALGAFLGAFFAFTFNQISHNIEKARKRFIIHKNSMVRIEYLIVKQQDQIGRLMFLLNETVKIINSAKFTHNRFNNLAIIPEIELNLGDINLINNVSDYWISLERVNRDLDSINRLIETIQTLGLSGIMPNKKNFAHLAKRMGEISNHLKNTLFDENITLNAYLRVLMSIEKKTKPIINMLRNYKILEHEVSDVALNSEKEKIYDEIKNRSK